MTSKTARVNAALKGTLSAEEMKLRASGLEMLRINATNRLWLPHDVVEGLVLTEAQLVALAKAKSEKEAHGEFESEHPGYCGAQDTFYVGNLKGGGRVYQQTFINTYAKVACAKLYDRNFAQTVP